MQNKRYELHPSPNVVKHAVRLAYNDQYTSETHQLIFGFLTRLPGGECIENPMMRSIPDEATMGWRELQLLTDLLTAIQTRLDTVVAIAILMFADQINLENLEDGKVSKELEDLMYENNLMDIFY